MTEDTKIKRVQQGHQPKNDKLTRGYQVTQPVDLSNLKIPQSMSDAAVTPMSIADTAPAHSKSEKK